MEANGKYPIRAVSFRTGLSPHVIRMWERRYEVVRPERLVNNRRLYSESDIERLSMLKAATEAGHNIGNVAGLDDEQLFRLTMKKHRSAAEKKTNLKNSFRLVPGEIVDNCLEAILALDPLELERSLNNARIMHSVPLLLKEVFVPLVLRVGELWWEGKLRTAEEHFASIIIMNHLGRIIADNTMEESNPAIVFATPRGHRHEIGSMLAAVQASVEGWKVIYLGPDLPVEEIASVARKCEAKIVAVSLIFPIDNTSLVAEVGKLAKILDDTIAVVAGGAAAEEFAVILESLDVIVESDLDNFRNLLNRIRNL